MKQTISLLIVALLFAAPVFSQSGGDIKKAVKSGNHVKACEYLAKRLTEKKKMKKGDIVDFVEYFPIALSEIDMAKESQDGMDGFAYETVISDIQGWLDMYSYVAKLPSELVDKKGRSVSIEVVDYKPYFDQTKQKAIDARYNAAKELFDGSGSAETKLQILEHEKVISGTLGSKSYKDMDDMCAEVNYTYGKNIIATGADYQQKRGCFKYFNAAIKFKRPYKDIDQMAADLLYNEAERLFAIKTFEAQGQAAGLYKSARSWSKGYKDAADKEKAALKNSNVTIVFADEKGSFVDQNVFLLCGTKPKMINDHLPSYMQSVNPTKTKASNQNALDGSTLEWLGTADSRYIVIRYVQGTPANGIYSVDKETTTREVGHYTQTKKDPATNKMVTSEITEKDYEAGLKVQKLAGNDGGITLRAYKGTITTVTETATLKVPYKFEICDTRGGFEKLGETEFYVSYSDKKVTLNYAGDSKAKPKNRVFGDNGAPVPSKQDLANGKSGVEFTVAMCKHLKADDMKALAAKIIEVVKYEE